MSFINTILEIKNLSRPHKKSLRKFGASVYTCKVFPNKWKVKNEIFQTKSSILVAKVSEKRPLKRLRFQENRL